MGEKERRGEGRGGEGREIVAVGAMLQGQTDRREIDGKIIDFMEDRHSDTHTHTHTRTNDSQQCLPSP